MVIDNYVVTVRIGRDDTFRQYLRYTPEPQHQKPAVDLLMIREQ